MDKTKLNECRAKQDWKGAEEETRALLALDPCDAETWYLQAECQAYQGNHQESKRSAFKAIALNPTLYPAWCFLANAHAGLGEWAGVVAATERALGIAPDVPFAHWLRAHGKMAEGNWPEAWRSYAFGCLTGKRQPRCLGPQWDGTPIPGKTLFVWGEQGHGDQIMYARFLAKAKEVSGASILAEFRPALTELLAPLADITVAEPPDKCMAFGFDYQIPLMDLPNVLQGYALEAMTGEAFLAVEPREDTKGKIGFTWQGFKGHPNDRNRSLPAEMLERFKGVPNLVGINPGADCPEWLPSVGHLADFKATAEALAGLSLLVTVDTSTAHLAGALGVPVVMIAPLGNTEARWAAGDSTPWYRSWRIVHAGDWEEAVCATLKEISEPPSKTA